MFHLKHDSAWCNASIAERLPEVSSGVSFTHIKGWHLGRPSTAWSHPPPAPDDRPLQRWIIFALELCTNKASQHQWRILVQNS
jgi:hypothetical protein